MPARLLRVAFLTISAAMSLILSDQLCISQQQSKAEVGYVLEVRGGWMANSTSSRLLHLGEPVYAGQVVRAFSNLGPWKVTIAFLDGSDPKTYTCGPDCMFEVPSPPPSDPTIIKLQKAVQHLLESREPERVFVITRGVKPEEAVLQLKPEAALQLKQDDKRFDLDVGAVMKNISDGQYTVEMAALCPTQPAGSSVHSFKYAWTRASPAPLHVGELVPGVYKFSLRTGEGEPIDESPAAVLVAPAKSFQQAANDFEEAAQVESQWKNAEAGHYFLTAYLYVLAQCSGER